MKLDTSCPPRVRVLTRPSETWAETSTWRCRHLNLPYERGQSDLKSLTETDEPGFMRFNAQAHPPADSAPLAPLRDLAHTTEPCSGLLSVAAQTDLGLRKNSGFIDRVYPPSDLRVPVGVRDRPQTPTLRPSAPSLDLSEYKRCNSRNKLEYARQVRDIEQSPSKTACYTSPEKDTGSLVLSEFMEKAARRYIYIGYEDVDWDSKLPPRLKPPMTTLEKMADPVNQHFTLKRYNSRPELWQAVGPHWNKHQLRATYNAKKPVSFTSPCAKSGQIPLYCGVVGSENMDGIDNPEQNFTPLTLLRTIMPPYTPTAHRPTIPGYTGKALHNRPHTALSFLSSPPPHLTPGNSLSSSAYGRRAPLSRMVTTVPPGNPYLHPKTPTLPIRHLFSKTTAQSCTLNREVKW
ncbi:protein SPMIP7 isoform X2 [Hoplias malabaricus]|uniref:protein SPMIP7 isoform X2 n=1 Tax=Hoplias malabaricus TaxID=27720 RepID=UPI003461EA84